MKPLLLLIALLTLVASAQTRIPINVGSSPNDGTGDSLRAAMIKINANFSNLFDSLAVTNPVPAAQFGLVSLTAVDNGPQLQEAIDRAYTDKVFDVVIPPGWFWVSNTLLLPGGISLRGA